MIQMNPEKKYNFLLALATLAICIIAGALMNVLVNYLNNIPLFPLRRGLLTLMLFSILGVLIVIFQYIGYLCKHRRG
jgi:hypothetical protein